MKYFEKTAGVGNVLKTVKRLNPLKRKKPFDVVQDRKDYLKKIKDLKDQGLDIMDLDLMDLDKLT